MTAAKAAAEQHGQRSQQTDAQYPHRSRSHAPMVTVDSIVDKRLVNLAEGGTLMPMRRLVDAEWHPTVPALVQLVAASAAPHLRSAFADAGLDGIRPAQSVALVPLAAGGLHASDLADRLRVSRQAVAQAITGLERHGYVSRVPDPDDARARIIELTPRGREALRVMRSNAVNLEKRWQDVLGGQRFAELRETLQLLLAAEAHGSGG